MISVLKSCAKRSPIGLDVGESGIRAAQLRRTGDRWSLAALGKVEHRQPPAAAPKEAGRAEQAATPGTRQDEVRECLRQARFSGRDLVVALNGPQAEYLALELPKAVLQAETAEARGAVRYEVQRLSSAAASGVEIETAHWTLPATAVAAPNAIGVSVRSQAVLDLLQLTEDAGMSCCGVDGAATALCRFGGLLHDWPDDQVWGVLDLGQRQTRLVLSIGDVPVLVRPAGSGGQDWTERIAESLHITPKASEVLKREHGVDSTRLGTVLSGALRGELNDLATEVKRSYEYVLSCYPNRRAADLILVGGSAALSQLPEMLRNLLGISVRRAGTYLEAPGCRVSASAAFTSLPALWETCAVAVGLAVGD